MNILYKLLRADKNTREGVIAATSALGIFVNLLLAAGKVLVGALASSIAIISEGVNNAADVFTALLTLIGTKLAGKHPDEKHPFGYGRIEYLTGLVIAVLILVSGVEMAISSVKLIFTPQELSVSYLSLAVVAGSAVVKFFLGTYTIRMGKKTDSGALEGVGEDCRNDSFASVITIASALAFLLFGLSVDAYAGLITSALIVKAGIGVLRSTVGEIIGRPGEAELARRLYKMIRAQEGILNAADMMLHNYGPDRWSGSVNVEIDHEKTVAEAYAFLHALQLKIMHEEHVTMVFGIYAVDNDHADSHAIRSDIAAYIRTKEHIKSYHAVYVEPETGKIYCDLTVDYALKDWEALRKDFTAYMTGKYPQNALELTIETDFV